MECFAITLSLPAGLCAGLGYSYFINKFVAQFPRLSKLFVWVSGVVLVGLIIEFVLLITIGAVESRGLLGPTFSIAHFIIFILGTPALANILVLPQKVPFLGRWYVAGVLCGCLFTVLVIMQYHVAKSLYGIDGVGGPYS